MNANDSPDAFDEEELGGDIDKQRGILSVRTALAHTGILHCVNLKTVMAMAIVPQKQTRDAPRRSEAPPVFAAKAPRTPSVRIVAEGTIHKIAVTGIIAESVTGMAAPAAKVAAEVKAACRGRAHNSWVIPISSRA